VSLLVLQRLRYLQQRDTELTARLDALTRELVAAAAGTGQTALPMLLRATTEQLGALQAAHRDLQSHCGSLRDQVVQLEVRGSCLDATIVETVSGHRVIRAVGATTRVLTVPNT
jgi:hypothetical protein